MDFAKFHNRLIDYLKSKGIQTGPGNVPCFSPNHVHSGKNTPSMQIGYNSTEGKETYLCYNQTCSIHGDIYDAVEILEGIKGSKEQYLFLENYFGSGYTPAPPPPGAGYKDKENFTADPDAQKKLENYLNNNPSAEKEIIKFLNIRAAASSLGIIQSYPADLIPAMVKHFYYWPGLGRVRQDLGADLLRAAGIPLKNPNTGIAWWDHTGVILKLGKGYKLHYYLEGDCKKFGSKGSSTFPMPGTIDKTKPVILVEGEMDAVSSVCIGIENLFATGGTNGITGPKIKNYLLDVSEIILCFDADDAGRKSSGLIPIDEVFDKKKTNIPDIIRNAGFTGKIKIAELPVGEKERDQDALVIAGKRDIIKKAIQEAKEYIPPEKKADNKIDQKWDILSIKRIKSILKKITKTDIENKRPADVQVFITALLKACKYPIGVPIKKKGIEVDLLEWGATEEQIQNKNDTSPYILIEFAWEYGLSKYLQKVIEIELTPASELLKKINRQKPIVDIDFEEIKSNKNVIQFLETYGERAAALVVSDIVDGRIIYVEAEKKYYFFNGHVWRREPDMTGVIYNIIVAVMYYFYEKIGSKEFDKLEFNLKKSDISEIIVRMESRRFRVEIMQEFSQLEQFNIFKTSVLFDGPAIVETLTLIDGVMDFSGKEIVYRKSNRDEYRRAILPYTVEQIKTALKPERFINFMKGNFKNDKTLESLIFYLSLIASRNTKNKYGGVFIGETGTGKTTTMDIFQVVYPDMIKTIPAEVLVSKGMRQVTGNEANPYIAKLEGMGCGLASETGRNMYLNNALWKLLTGGDIVPARDLYEKAHEFVPTAQIIILTNYLPLFDSHDNATIQRMIIIPFLVQHKRGEKDLIQIDEFKKQLKPEYPAIIKYFAEYYIKLKHEYRGAIPLSDECKKYKQSYIEELDTDIDRFVKDCIMFDVSEDAFIMVQTVYERYLKYFKYTTEDAGKEALTRQKFTRYFRRDYKLLGYKQKKINGNPELCFFNIKFKPDTGQTAEPRPEDETTAAVEKINKSSAPPDDDPFN